MNSANPARRGLRASPFRDWSISRKIEGAIIAPLERLVADQDRQRSEETEATKVDFFTLVRGED